jgi:hypothetical protein
MHVKNNRYTKTKQKHLMIYRIDIIFYLIIKNSLLLCFLLAPLVIWKLKSKFLDFINPIFKLF